MLNLIPRKVKKYVSTLKTLTLPELLSRIFNVVLHFLQSIIYWNVCKLISGTEAPLTVVLTGSMEPGFTRGDIMGVRAIKSTFGKVIGEPQISVGDIAVWQQQKKPVPIVHRIIAKRTIIKDGKKVFAFITKGDANSLDDRGIYDYDNGRKYLLEKNIIGALAGNCPAIGFLTIYFKENKYFKIFFYSLVTLSALLGYYEG